jgi:hypothetical protein
MMTRPESVSCFKGYECFMIVKEKEMDQDPTESEVSQKLTSYTTPQLNQKTWPKYVGGKEEVVGLKKPQHYRQRR